MLKSAAIFNNNMVLQQDSVLPVWGTGSPGTHVTVQFAGQIKSALTDINGDWRVNLEPMAASFVPQEMSIMENASEHPRIVLRNILIGEVWLCSGQSNMKLPVSGSKNAAREITEADIFGIRLLTIPRLVADAPRKHIDECAWEICAPETVSGFSATGYFFGRELYHRLGVPVGLIDSSCGGSIAEAWTSRETLMMDTILASQVFEYERTLPFSTALNAKYSEDIRLLEQRTRDIKNEGFPCGWADVSVPSGEWNDMELPSAWQCRGLDFSGILWFRKEILLPSEWAGHELRLSIGAADKSDTTYFNNVKVGGIAIADTTDSWKLHRCYKVPGNLVKTGRNVIAVRVHSDKFSGGMTGPAEEMGISCPSLPESPIIPVTGYWKYAVESNYGKVEIPVMPPGKDNYNCPSVLFNGMIYPLIPYAIRGVIWYQGESNTTQASQYRTLFPALIQDWRKHWETGNFPFLFVQLANYKLEQPVQTTWAELREAQTMALRLPNTAMAVAIDIGEAGDIHPKNKQDVGLRLALNALAKVYNRDDIVCDSPMFRFATKEGKALRIHFNNVNGGLKCRGDKVLGFEIAGIDRKFTEAQAEIEGATILVHAPEESESMFVRYAWKDNPACNLYNDTGLPVAPFRSDMFEKDLFPENFYIECQTPVRQTGSKNKKNLDCKINNKQH